MTGFFALRKADLMEKDGRFRLSLELVDATGRVGAVMWDVAKEEAALYSVGQVVKIRGVTTTYQERLQIKVEQMRPAAAEEYDLGDFLRRSLRSREELSSTLDSMVGKVQNGYLGKLLQAIFGDPDIRSKYLTLPAAKQMHHDTVGGLADHSLSMAEIVVRLADMYPKLDRDLLLAGALLHDIGKIWDYEMSAAIDFTDAGRLVGHISQGDEYITRMTRTVDLFPDELLMHLRHLIVSHQGKLEQGAPVLPMTPEALFLYCVDELDAKMGAVEKIRERTGDTGWSEYQRVLERYFYFGREEKKTGEGNSEND